VRVRDAAEKAWNAVVQATDHAMGAHGRVPLPGREAHESRRSFLEQVGRRDPARDYAYLAERLHGDAFYAGASLPPGDLRRLIDEARDTVDKVAGV